MKSELEKIGDKTLFTLLKVFLKNSNGEIDVRDDDVFTAAQNACKLFSLECYPEDLNYIISTVRLNTNVDFTSKIPIKLKRPKGVKYSFDIDEFRTEYVRRTYRNEIISYDEKLILDSIESLNDQGFDYYEGKEVDVDYYDGETTDVTLDKSSIIKIGRD